jgi:hypothetical protein
MGGRTPAAQIGGWLALKKTPEFVRSIGNDNTTTKQQSSYSLWIICKSRGMLPCGNYRYVAVSGSRHDYSRWSKRHIKDLLLQYLLLPAMYGLHTHSCGAVCSIATRDGLADCYRLLLLSVLLLAAAACCCSVLSVGDVAAVVPDVAVCKDCCMWLLPLSYTCTIHAPKCTHAWVHSCMGTSFVLGVDRPASRR